MNLFVHTLRGRKQGLKIMLPVSHNMEDNFKGHLLYAHHKDLYFSATQC